VEEEPNRSEWRGHWLRSNQGKVPFLLSCRRERTISGDAWGEGFLFLNGGSNWAESTVHGSLKLSKQPSVMMRVAFFEDPGSASVSVSVLSCAVSGWNFRGPARQRNMSYFVRFVLNRPGKSTK